MLLIYRNIQLIRFFSVHSAAQPPPECVVIGLNYSVLISFIRCTHFVSTPPPLYLTETPLTSELQGHANVLIETLINSSLSESHLRPLPHSKGFQI